MILQRNNCYEYWTDRILLLQKYQVDLVIDQNLVLFIDTNNHLAHLLTINNACIWSQKTNMLLLVDL